MVRLHALVAEQLGAEDLGAEQVRDLGKVGIETDRGSWVAALVAAGYEVFPINPLSVAGYRERHSTSGAKSDLADAHVLAEIVRVDRAHHRPLAGDSEAVEANQVDRSLPPDSGVGADRAPAAAAGCAARRRRSMLSGYNA